MNLEYPFVDRAFRECDIYLTDHPAAGRAKTPPTDRPRRPVQERPANIHYSMPERRWRLWVSMGFSAAVMGAGLLGFNGHPRAKIVRVDSTPTLTLIELPKILPDEDDEPTDTHAPDNNAAVDVPALPDVPATVSLENSFVQQIDYSTLKPHTAVDSENLRAIPALIRHSGAASALRGLKDIFNLSDLDHIPEPVFQPMPRVTDRLLEGAAEAHVVVDFIVTQTGDVLDPQIVKAEPYRVADATLAAVSKWRFRPGVKNGKHVNTRVRQPILIKPSVDE